MVGGVVRLNGKWCGWECKMCVVRSGVTRGVW